MAALEKGVETRKKRGVLEAPRILRSFLRRLRLVIEVVRLERAAHLERRLELLHCLWWLHLEDLLAHDKLLRLHNEVVANLAHQDHDPPRRVVVVRVLPYQQHSVHDGFEELGELRELVREVKLLEIPVQGFEEQHVVVGFDARCRHLLTQPMERGVIARLGNLKHLDNLADLQPAELLVDSIEVRRLVLPKLELGQRAGVQSILQRCLGVSLEHPLYLPCPRHDRRLQHVDLVFISQPLVARTTVSRGQRQERLALRLPYCNVHIGDKLVQILNHLLGDDLGPSHLVPRIAQHG
mmetsp:Transcript_14317/g.34859  ORF Transcript_14317/g.34859 Transcript_14317/m.34859 type:complete len:295 (-) Transcript_14317:702-1586(-)